MTFEEALALGKVAEAELLRHLARQGMHAIGVYKDGDDEADGGPRVHTADGLLVAADVMYIKPDGRAGWVEVKSKSNPGYNYKARVWEHGVNARLFRRDYRILAERAPLFLAVKELRTLPWEGFLPPAAPTRADGRRDFTAYKQHLIDGPAWWWISYEDAKRYGSLRADWPHRGRDGWLWPRDAMTAFPVAP